MDFKKLQSSRTMGSALDKHEIFVEEVAPPPLAVFSCCFLLYWGLVVTLRSNFTLFFYIASMLENGFLLVGNFKHLQRDKERAAVSNVPPPKSRNKLP